jgi:hypothetical protein
LLARFPRQNQVRMMNRVKRSAVDTDLSQFENLVEKLRIICFLFPVARNDI